MKRRHVSRLRIVRQITEGTFCSVGLKPPERSKKAYIPLLQIVCSHADVILVHLAWIISYPHLTVGAWTLWSPYRLD
jgi:hypothetical protein